MLRLIIAAFAWIALVLGAADARAEAQTRVALVVGNGAYQYLPHLPNPANDATLVAATLKSLGFTLIGDKAQTDLDRDGFARVVREFGAQITGGGVGLFYYAGHGVQVQGVNYLVPIGANPATVADVDFDLIDAGLVLKQMEAAGSKLNLVILDACRNNPFGGRGLRDSSGGLAQMRAPQGTLISYATQPGNVAMDGSDGHSPYTSALTEAMQKPGVPVLEVFNDVGVAVDKVTGGRQQPWVSTSPLEGNFYFLGPATANASPALPGDAELLFWQSTMSSGTTADFEAYLKQFPEGRFVPLARNRLASVQSPHPAPEPTPSPRSEVIAPPPQSPPVNQRELARTLQTELHRVGCYAGVVDGVWGTGSQAAVQQFNQRAGKALDTQIASLDSVTVIKERTDRVCPAPPPVKRPQPREATQDGRGQPSGTYQAPAYQAPAYQPPATAAPPPSQQPAARSPSYYP